MSSLEVPWAGLGEEEGQEPGGPARRGNSTGRSGVSGPHGVSFAAEGPLRGWGWGCRVGMVGSRSTERCRFVPGGLRDRGRKRGTPRVLPVGQEDGAEAGLLTVVPCGSAAPAPSVGTTDKI